MALPNTATKDDKEAVTFEEALKRVGTGYFQIKLTIIGGLVLLSSYFSVGVITFVLPLAHCDLRIDYEDRGNLASISFVGLILTCHMWGFLSDTLGRRYILIRCLFLDALLYFITMAMPNYYIILFLRFFNGVASCGGVVSIYAYIGEFQTDKFRSRAIMISSFIAATAYMLLPTLAWLTIPGKWSFELYPGLVFRSWRLFYVVCGLPSFFSAILLFFLPESPKFLLAKGKTEKAMDVLKRMHKANNKKDNEFMIKSIKLNEGERVRKLDNNKHKVLAVFHLLWTQTVPLFRKPHGFNFMLLCVGLFVCYFCNNGMYVWLPEAIDQMKPYKNFTQNEEGSFCEILYGGRLNNAMGKTLNNSSIMATGITGDFVNKAEPACIDDEIDTSVYFVYLLFGIVTCIGWVVIASTIKYMNKKYVIVLLTCCNLIATISMKWSNAVILMPVKACLIMVFTSCAFPIINSVVVDLFPTNLRAMAGCLTLMASRLGTVVTHEVTGFLIQSNCGLLMWFYIILAAVSLLSCSLLPSSPSASEKPTSEATTPEVNEQELRHPDEV